MVFINLLATHFAHIKFFCRGARTIYTETQRIHTDCLYTRKNQTKNPLVCFRALFVVIEMKYITSLYLNRGRLVEVRDATVVKNSLSSNSV